MNLIGGFVDVFDAFATIASHRHHLETAAGCKMCEPRRVYLQRLVAVLKRISDFSQEGE